MKRLMALLLAGILLLSLVPAQVLATDETTQYEVGATLTFADSTDPNENADLIIPENTKWVQVATNQQPSEDYRCVKEEHRHTAECDCILEEHTHVLNCPETCDKAHTHTPEECCTAVHEHGTDCSFDHEEHKNHEDSCYTNCPVHTCTAECQIPEGGTCPNIHSHNEECVPACEKEIHSHTDECCTAVHTHSADCIPNCGKEEHTHITDGCGGEGICTKEEHVHGDSETCQMACIKEDHKHDDSCRTMITYTTWKLVEIFTVTFNTNGGTGTIEPQYVAHGGTVTEPTPPTREGHVFGGWYTEKENPTNKWNFDPTDNIPDNTVSSNITLYAKWLKAVTVKFDVRQGTPLIESQTVAEGSTITEPEPPTRTNYDFNGWYDSSLETQWDFDSAVTKNMTLYAGWLTEVTFDSKNNTAVTKQPVLVGKPVEEPDDPTREGCTFDGWYSNTALTNKWDFNNKVDRNNLKLYAKWLANVTFNLNYTGSAAPQTETVTADTLLTAPTKPSREGYVFDGWYKESATTNKWDFTTDKVTRNITLYAKWLDSVTVTFNSNGGSTVSAKTVAKGGKVTQPDDPVKSNKLFDGWYKDSGLTTKWNFNSDTVSSNTTLYAKWKNNPLIVSRKTTGNLYPGDTETFIAKYNTTDDVSSKVTWKVERADNGTCASGTKFSGSKLTIDDDEKVGTLKITATSTEYGTDFITVTIYPLYKFKDGSGGKWAQKSTKNLTFECNGPMKEISKDGIMIDSKPVKEENYTHSESTYGFKLVLKPAAMKDLTVKKHTLTITFDDGGKAETTFEVVKESDIPETGDALPLWMTLFGVTAAAALVLLKKRSL